ncbi:DNA sulfur modification protein DndB [Streptomyces sp. NPDC048243]|uniref:DNA sulfur modification protein DndB n=1 Tax=Streptomyces sp. NPDC048243 TaxID=3365522 RepID=UPI0037204C16
MELRLPGIGYKQGTREMVVTAMDPTALVKTVAEPEHWNPVGQQPHGNRPVDKQHRKGIAEYLAAETNFVLNSVVLYAKPQEARFEVAETDQEKAVRPGTLVLHYGAQFDVGDGQHRIAAYSDVMKQHPDEEDPVRIRMRKSGQPVVVVIDANPLHRAQDFTDLQRNTKPQTASLAMSMDRRQAINRLLIELVQDPALPIFGQNSNRVEFFSDSPGKFSAKLFSFKTIRYLSGTVLIGVGQRSTAGWDSAVNAQVSHDQAAASARLRDLWEAMGEWSDIDEIISGARTTADLREKTYLASSGVLYAIAYAVHKAHYDHGIPLRAAVERVGTVSFARVKPEEDASSGEIIPLTRKDTIFAGTLVDPDTGKVGSGRPAWEAASEDLLAVIREK